MVVTRRGGHAARMESINTGGTMTSASQDTLAPIAHGPGEGEHLWFFGGLTTIKADGAKTGEQARFLLVTEPAGFEGFVRALAAPAAAPEIPPAPTAPPDMGPVLGAAADHGLEILGPPGIPA